MGLGKRKRHNHNHIDESWLVPYADILTLLLALFIVLFAASSTDSKKFAAMVESFQQAFQGGTGVMQHPSPIPPETNVVSMDKQKPTVPVNNKHEQLSKLKDDLDKYIKTHGFEAKIETKLVKDRLVITIRDHALFDSGSAVVTPEAKNLGISLSNMLAGYKQYEVQISGHTDNRPIHTAQFDSNWDLSAQRALNFMKVILSNKQLNPSKFQAVGYGEHRPIASNNDSAGRAKNRRVEVSISDQ